MESGSGKLNDLLPVLEAVQLAISLRVALTAEGSGWLARAMVADAFPELPNDTWAIRNYGPLMFLQAQVSGPQVAKWLSEGSATVNGVVFACSLNEHQNWTRHPSHASYGSDVVPWPYTRYELRFTTPAQFNASSVGFLLSDDAPFFPDYGTAVAKLLYRSDRAQADEIVLVRIAQTEAWISDMHLSPTAMTVDILGTNPKGASVHFSGTGLDQVIEAIGESNSVRFALPHGIPESGYVVLGRGNKWLDYRQLSRLIADSQATVDAPDLVTQYEQLRYRGEGEGLEFKEQTPSDKDKDRMLKTVAAFANGNGGVILFGIEDGTGALKGLQVDPAEETDRITNMIRTVLVPQPTFKILSARVEGKLVMSLTVEGGNNPPYGIHPEKPEYYVRRGSTTFPARQEEVRTLAQPPTTGPYGSIPDPLARIGMRRL